MKSKRWTEVRRIVAAHKSWRAYYRMMSISLTVLTIITLGLLVFAGIDYKNRYVSYNFGVNIHYSNKLPKDVPIRVTIDGSNLPKLEAAEDSSEDCPTYRRAVLSWTKDQWAFIHVVYEEDFQPNLFNYLVDKAEKDGGWFKLAQESDVSEYRRPRIVWQPEVRNCSTESEH